MRFFIKSILLLSLFLPACCTKISHPANTLITDTVAHSYEIRHELPIIEAYINGKGPFHLLLDTGCEAPIIISDRVADSLRLRPFGLTILQNSSGHHSFVSNVRLDTVDIGTAKFSSTIAPCSNHRELFDWLKIDGVAGYALFRNCTLVINGPNKMIQILSGSRLDDDGNNILPMCGKNEYRPVINVQASIADNPLRRTHVLIDTGFMGGFELPSEFRQDVPQTTKTVPCTTRTFSKSIIENYYYIPVTMNIGSAGHAKVDAITFSASREGLLGQAILSKLIIMLDGPKQRVKFIPEPSMYDHPASTIPATSPTP